MGRHTDKTELRMPGVKLVFFTMIWGDRLAQYLPGALERAVAFGHGHRFIIFCVGDVSCNICLGSHSHNTHCVRGRLQTIYNKYTMLSALVRLGVDVVYLDFDTLLLRDPLPP